MTWEAHLSPRIKRLKDLDKRQTRDGIGEKTDKFKMVHFPDRPLKRILRKDIPREDDCKRIFFAWKNGMMRVPSVRSLRPDEYIRKRRLFKPFSYSTQPLQRSTRRKSSKKYKASQRRRDTNRSPSFHRDLSRKAKRAAQKDKVPNKYQTARPLQDISASNGIPLKVSEPVYLPEKFPTNTAPNRSSRPSLISPSLLRSNTAPFTCPLCRSPTTEDGSLCNTCKEDFAMSAGGCTNDGKEDSLDPWRLLPAAPYSTHDRYASSVYSLCSPLKILKSVSPDLSESSGTPRMSVSPGSTLSDRSIMSIPIIYQPKYGEPGGEDDEVDLYDLDWAEYYFDENNFRGRE